MSLITWLLIRLGLFLIFMVYPIDLRGLKANGFVWVCFLLPLQAGSLRCPRFPAGAVAAAFLRLDPPPPRWLDVPVTWSTSLPRSDLPGLHPSRRAQFSAPHHYYHTKMRTWVKGPPRVKIFCGFILFELACEYRPAEGEEPVSVQIVHTWWTTSRRLL
jgi:hypothetical protein